MLARNLRLGSRHGQRRVLIAAMAAVVLVVAGVARAANSTSRPVAKTVVSALGRATAVGGRGWPVVATPKLKRGGPLQAISCVSNFDCIAVGNAVDNIGLNAGNVGLVEKWNGSRWSIMSTPQIKGDSGLTAVSCLSGSDCTAVGASGLNSEVSAVLVEHWNGSKWSIVKAPTVRSGTLWYGVSCGSRTRCAAVGQSRSGGPAALLLAEDTTRAG